VVGPKAEELDAGFRLVNGRRTKHALILNAAVLPLPDVWITNLIWDSFRQQADVRSHLECPHQRIAFAATDATLRGRGGEQRQLGGLGGMCCRA